MEILAGSLLSPDTVNPTDYPIQDTDLEKIGYRGNHPHVHLDQRDLAPYGNVSCFYTAAFKICADAYVLDAAERKIAVQAWKDGWAAIVKDGKVVPGFGGRLSDGIDYSRRSWNFAFPNKKVRTYRGWLPRFDVDSKLHQHFYRAMFNKWMVQFGGYVDDVISGEMLDGTVITDTKPVGDKVYGHSRDMFGWQSSPGSLGGMVTVYDNFPKLPNFPNVYKMDDLETKVKNAQLFPSYFIALPA
jgi:hypothetical protein